MRNTLTVEILHGQSSYFKKNMHFLCKSSLFCIFLGACSAFLFALACTSHRLGSVLSSIFGYTVFLFSDTLSSIFQCASPHCAAGS